MHQQDVVLIYMQMLTFSNPQNLSLPSSRKGPMGASSKYFSNGVICNAFGSFLAGDEPGVRLDVP